MICELHGPRRLRITRNSFQTPATASWDPKLPICSEYQFVAASRKTKITILRFFFQKHSKLQPWWAQGKGTLPHVRNMHPLQCRPGMGTCSPLGYHRTLVRFGARIYIYSIYVGKAFAPDCTRYESVSHTEGAPNVRFRPRNHPRDKSRRLSVSCRWYASI